MSTGSDTVLMTVKTPLMPRPTSARVNSRLTVSQALREIRKVPPRDANARRVLEQIERETSGQHDFLALSSTNEVVKIDPEKTVLEDIAVPREVRTMRGVETVPVAAFEVQAYAPVGN